jgi:hypothetical protein
MASTVFVDGTVIEKEWMNDVNYSTYHPIYADRYATLALAAAAVPAKGKLILTSGTTYPITSPLVFNTDVVIESDGVAPAIIETATNTSDAAISFGSDITAAVTTTLAANVSVNRKTITVTDATGITAGMLLLLRSTKAWYHDPREESSISPDSDATGTAQAGGASTITLKAGTTETSFAGLALTIQSGTGAGQARVVQSYESATKVATMTTPWKTAPDNTSVYRFAQLFKGELHLVQSVSGNEIELDAQTMDGYDVVDDTYGDGLEAVTVTAYNPIRVKMSNVHIKRPATNNANSYGIQIRYGLDVDFDRVAIDYGQRAGVNFVYCYRPTIVPYIRGSNDELTGYGVSDSGSSFLKVLNGNFWGCRRGVDFSGTTPSSYGLVAFCTVTGGGPQDDGDIYQPEGTIDNFGFGTHGTSRRTTFYKNRMTGVARGINIRGRDTKIIDNEFFGWFGENCIDLSLGCNIEISGNSYHNGFSEGSRTSPNGQIEANAFDSSNISNRQAPVFLRVFTNWERGATDVLRNTARNLNRHFILFDTAIVDFYDFNVQNNFARFEPNSNALECALIGEEAGALTLFNLTQSNNTIEASISVDEVYFIGTGVTISGTGDTAINGLGSPIERTFQLADDTANSIRVGQRGTQCRFELVVPGALGTRFNGMLQINSTTLTSMGASSNVNGWATTLAGTTGTDTFVNVHYNGTNLFIENRLGAAADFYVRVLPML